MKPCAFTMRFVDLQLKDSSYTNTGKRGGNLFNFKLVFHSILICLTFNFGCFPSLEFFNIICFLFLLIYVTFHIVSIYFN